MKKLLVLFVCITLSLSAFAHENHTTPGSMKSLHGGVVQSGKENNLEVIINGNEVTVFPTTHEAQDIPAKDVQISATAMPKKGKSYPVEFKSTKSGFTASVDLKGANRLPLSITITAKGKSDKFTIQVEE
ncbi:MAG: hypothetical protein WC635_17330 [Bacteriovorax sp.]|jgi:hypothetical protein